MHEHLPNNMPLVFDSTIVTACASVTAYHFGAKHQRLKDSLVQECSGTRNALRFSLRVATCRKQIALAFDLAFATSICVLRCTSSCQHAMLTKDDLDLQK